MAHKGGGQYHMKRRPTKGKNERKMGRKGKMEGLSTVCPAQEKQSSPSNQTWRISPGWRADDVNKLKGSTETRQPAG